MVVLVSFGFYVKVFCGVETVVNVSTSRTDAALHPSAIEMSKIGELRQSVQRRKSYLLCFGHRKDCETLNPGPCPPCFRLTYTALVDLCPSDEG